MTTTNVTASEAHPTEREAAVLHELVEYQALREPNATAVVSIEGDTLTYGDLLSRARDLTTRLRAAGVGHEDRVAVTVPRSPTAIVAFLGVLGAGAAYVPIDPDFPLERQRFMVRDCRAAAVVAPRGPKPDFVDDGVPMLFVDTDSDIDSDAGDCPDADPLAELAAGPVRPDQAAYVIYTSGSTGVPKGVVVEHAAVVALVLDDERIAVRQGQSVAQYAPLAFDASTFEIWAALCRGGRVEILRGGPVAVEDLSAELAKRRPDWLFLTTGLFHVLADHAPHALEPVGTLITGGDVLSPQHVQTAAAVPGLRVLAAYGPTETTTFASLHAATSDATWDRVPIGTPLRGRTMYVLDEDLREVARGETGELFVGGAGVARGYLHRSALTAERFLPDPFAPGRAGRMYRTGDLARCREDGAFEFCGRSDRQVKIRGYRIEPGEIEAVLNARPEVAEAVVAVFGTAVGGKRLVGYAVPAGDARVTASTMRTWLRERLPAHMVPGTCLVLDRMPHDPNGKPDRNALTPPWSSRDRLGELPEYLAPHSETETLMADVWAEVLGLDRVGVDDNFYELGGDSILSVDTIQRLRLLGIECSAGAFFRHQTIAELAAVTGVGRNGAR
ncbi:non-ribosomal peptide synthetase [Streptomyces sp. SID3343]|uniref:non-ribosomal peptide synthetase n=1 Tax=Streptomyces sp. SID3343 TaxID=2690260 RepID=UPI00137131B6|nr:non-ribosomal peptide synthetase [Streptomyces sp. SID3343]MYW03142.1 amino acid adenylation domain-containing protein [Streptomyces sp. SID3343]